MFVNLKAPVPHIFNSIPNTKRDICKEWLKLVSPDKYNQTLCQYIYIHAHKKAATQSIQLTGYCNTIQYYTILQ